MEILKGSDGRKILNFIGGPTGHESYYVDSLLHPEHGISIRGRDVFCICGGTINRWPRCEVPTSEVLKFLIDNLE